MLKNNVIQSPSVKLEYHAKVRDMPSTERPRERLRHNGAQALSTAELLAIILRTGTARDNVLELAGKLLAKYSGLGGLFNVEFGTLCTEHGLGEAKAAQLKAALEMGRRLQFEQPEERYRIKSPGDAAKLVSMEMSCLDHEEMRVLLLDTKNQVVENIHLYKGTVNTSVLRAAEVFRPAIVRNCPGVIVCHNHPSGDPTPSQEDIDTTTQLIEAGNYLDIELVDHIVIGKQRYVSLKERMHW